MKKKQKRLQEQSKIDNFMQENQIDFRTAGPFHTIRKEEALDQPVVSLVDVTKVFDKYEEKVPNLHYTDVLYMGYNNQDNILDHTNYTICMAVIRSHQTETSVFITNIVLSSILFYISNLSYYNVQNDKLYHDLYTSIYNDVDNQLMQWTYASGRVMLEKYSKLPSHGIEYYMTNMYPEFIIKLTTTLSRVVFSYLNINDNILSEVLDEETNHNIDLAFEYANCQSQTYIYIENIIAGVLSDQRVDFKLFTLFNDMINLYSYIANDAYSCDEE